MASKKMTNTVLAGAVAMAAVGGAIVGLSSTEAHALAKGKEKCYGVVKAGKNDCGNAAKTHSCAGHAATDGDSGEWLALPTGVCEKLVGGSLVGKVAEATPAVDAGKVMDTAADKVMEKGKDMIKDHVGHDH